MGLHAWLLFTVCAESLEEDGVCSLIRRSSDSVRLSGSFICHLFVCLFVSSWLLLSKLCSGLVDLFFLMEMIETHRDNLCGKNREIQVSHGERCFFVGASNTDHIESTITFLEKSSLCKKQNQTNKSECRNVMGS